jgi:hypothetical protein
MLSVVIAQRLTVTRCRSGAATQDHRAPVGPRQRVGLAVGTRAGRGGQHACWVCDAIYSEQSPERVEGAIKALAIFTGGPGRQDEPATPIERDWVIDWRLRGVA